MSSTAPGRVPLTLLVGHAEADRLAARIMPLLRNDGVGVLAPPPLAAALGDLAHPPTAVLGAEPTIGWRSSGCPCCAERLDVVDGVGSLLGRRRRPERLVVVVRPDDDVATVAQTVLADPDLRREAVLDAVVAAVDGPAIAARAATGLPPTDAEARTLGMADLVVAADGDRLTAEGLDRLTGWIHRHAPLADCAVPAVVPMEVGDLVARDAWASVPRVRRRDPLTCEAGPIAVALHAAGPLDADEVQEWLDDAVAHHGSRLLRLHAVVHVRERGRAGGPETVRCWCVRTFATSELVPAEDPRARVPGSRVVLVGEGLDADELARTFPVTS